VDDVDGLKHTPIREALRRCGYSRDIEIHHIADLPAKTGLGSSSSFSVSLLQALHKLDGRDLTGIDLAHYAIDFERRTLGENVGCQDQTFAAVGGFNMLEFHREDDVRVHPVAMSDERLAELEDSLFMFYSGVSRRAEDVIKQQLDKLGDNLGRYKSMRAQVDRAYDILMSNTPLSAFGELLDEAWAEKRALHTIISNPVIDQMYEKAKAAGAIGGKLLGAGAGGFLLLFVPPERQAAVRLALADHYLVRPRLRAPGSSVIFDGTKMRAPQRELRKVVG
jgi:D-glycero-alpha-D-manno-heptose-7-phosphate kinase